MSFASPFGRIVFISYRSLAIIDVADVTLVTSPDLFKFLFPRVCSVLLRFRARCRTLSISSANYGQRMERPEDSESAITMVPAIIHFRCDYQQLISNYVSRFYLTVPSTLFSRCAICAFLLSRLYPRDGKGKQLIYLCTSNLYLTFMIITRSLGVSILFLHHLFLSCGYSRIIIFLQVSFVFTCRKLVLSSS